MTVFLDIYHQRPSIPCLRLIQFHRVMSPMLVTLASKSTIFGTVLMNHLIGAMEANTPKNGEKRTIGTAVDYIACSTGTRTRMTTLKMMPTQFWFSFRTVQAVMP